MLEWTGERFLPWWNDPTLAYEHLHRYFYAAQFAQGKTVLDLASGEGYGSNLLSRTAQKVVGVDIAEEAVTHARSRYVRDNLEFVQGSITGISIAGNNIFDLIVCFEAIEHIEDHQGLLAEIHRLLKPDGLLFVSTPNKPVYDQANFEENTFHVKELEFEEFQKLLESRFRYVRYLGQRVFAESNLWPIPAANDNRVDEFVIERAGSEFESISREGRSPMYHIAIASNSPLERDPASSILVDNDNALLEEKNQQIHEGQREVRELRDSLVSSGEALRWREDQIEERNKTIQWFEGEVESLKREQAAQKDWYEREVTHREATIASNQEALKWRAGQVDSLEAEKADLSSRLEAMSRRLERSAEELEAIHASSGWKFLLRMRHYRDTLLPPDSLQRRFVDRIVRILLPKHS